MTGLSVTQLETKLPEQLASLDNARALHKLIGSDNKQKERGGIEMAVLDAQLIEAHW